MFYESRGESFEGMVLVAKTTLNRTAHPDFPRKICDVVYQPYQFSWTINSLKPKFNLDALRAAYAALTHPSEALYFHAKSVKPEWANHKQYLQTEGNHIFYK